MSANVYSKVSSHLDEVLAQREAEARRREEERKRRTEALWNEPDWFNYAKGEWVR